VAGFFVVIAFGVGLISEAAFGGSAGVVTASSTESTAGENAASIELGDLFIKPAEISLEPGDASITVANNGKTQHDFTVTGLAGTELLDPGSEENDRADGARARHLRLHLLGSRPRRWWDEGCHHGG
jgi:plastocyanin